MPSWEKFLLISISIIYFICLADFVSRSEQDLLAPKEICGLLEKVEYSNRTRRSERAVMMYLNVDNELQAIKIRFRNDKNPSKTYKALKRMPVNDGVCISIITSPLLSFLKYPMLVRSQDGELYFQANMLSTYFDKKLYIFWFFIILISFILARLLNKWVSIRRANA